MIRRPTAVPRRPCFVAPLALLVLLGTFGVGMSPTRAQEPNTPATPQADTAEPSPEPGTPHTNAPESEALQGTAVESAPKGLRVDARALRGPRADVAALLMTAQEGGSLWAAALAVPHPLDPPTDAGATTRVDFWLELDGARLVAEAGLDDPEALAASGEALPETLRLELHAYVLTRQGELAGTLSRRVTVPLGPSLTEGGVQLVAPFELGPGEYQLRVLVRESRSLKFALRLAEVTIPKGSKSWIGPPLRDAPGSSWIAVRDRSAAETAGVAALPVVGKGSPIPFEVTGQILAGTPIEAKLLDLEGSELARPRIEPPTWPGGAGRHGFTIDLEDFEPGPYRLAVGAAGEFGAAVQIALLPAGLAVDEVAWTGIDRLASAGPSETTQQEISPELEAERRASGRIATIAEAYREVLQTLTTGSLNEAAQQLDALETQVLATGESRSDALEWLIKAEERVAKQLTRQDPESLLPVLFLHLEVYGLYASGKIQPLRLIAARRRIQRLADEYGHSSPRGLARRLAATALAEAGIAVDRHNMPQEARRMLEAAFELDDGNPTQLLYLGYWYERRGHYEDAIRPLRRLITIDPGNTEGRLRLALCLRRLGKIEEAESLLRQLLREPAPDWLLTLGYQELARLLLDSGRYGDAISVLDEGILVYPEVQRFHYQRIYAHERSGTGYRVPELLRGLPADNGRLSARNLYSKRPRASRSGARATLLRHATARLPVLQVALSQSATR